MEATGPLCLCETLRLLRDLCGSGLLYRKDRKALANVRKGIPEKIKLALSHTLLQ